MNKSKKIVLDVDYIGGQGSLTETEEKELSEFFKQSKKRLKTVERIFVTTQKEETVKLYPEQKEMLMMSDADIAEGNVVSESELEKLDSQWIY